MIPSAGIHLFEVYLEEADTDEPRRFLDRMQANTIGEALQLASEYFEVPDHDLVVVQLTANQVFNPLPLSRKEEGEK